MENLLIYALLFLSCWSTILVFGIVGQMWCAKTKHVNCRRADVVELALLVGAAVVSSIIVFVHPGLIYNLPSTVAVLEIGSIPLLLYFSEKHIRNWAGLRRQNRKLARQQIIN